MNSKHEDNIKQLFAKEFEILNNSKSFLSDDNLKIELLKDNFELLSESYSKLLNQTIKFMNLSDNSQNKLKKIQDKLEETNEKINEQNEELTKVNSTKDKFFSIISHDIRNPITAIMLMADLLKITGASNNPEKIEKSISKIATSIKSLYNLFENLHSWASSQNGNIEFKPKSINLLIIVNNIHELLKVHSENKEIKLTSDVAPDAFIYADKNMIETVVRNLVSNAIKYTKKNGEVSINYDENETCHLINVKDNGTGMDSFTKNNLFNLGENVKKEGTAKEPGSGLGLILVKEFVEAHHGTITVESKIDIGSKFTISIPKNDRDNF